MDQGRVAAFVVMHDLLSAQPVEQLRTVRRFEDLAQGIAFFQALDVIGGSQQVQVVVAQHAHQGITQAI
ncbi:Uncharacterised protein [Mycobacterium tuberculosis]|nr:Uncharacterised protein [Mycobacterium tuberculosis]